MTWTAVSDTTDPSWSATTETTVIWQQLSSVTDNDGVDFILKVNDQYPLRVNDTRPAYVIDLEENV